MLSRRTVLGGALTALLWPRRLWAQPLPPSNLQVNQLPTYFGGDIANRDSAGGAPKFSRNKNLTLTCPGSGNQDIKELSAVVAGGSAPQGHVRVAIYSSDGNTKIAEGAAE